MVLAGSGINCLQWRHLELHLKPGILLCNLSTIHDFLFFTEKLAYWSTLKTAFYLKEFPMSQQRNGTTWLLLLMEHMRMMVAISI